MTACGWLFMFPPAPSLSLLCSATRGCGAFCLDAAPSLCRRVAWCGAPSRPVRRCCVASGALAVQNETQGDSARPAYDEAIPALQAVANQSGHCEAGSWSTSNLGTATVRVCDAIKTLRVVSSNACGPVQHLRPLMERGHELPTNTAILLATAAKMFVGEIVEEGMRDLCGVRLLLCKCVTDVVWFIAQLASCYSAAGKPVPYNPSTFARYIDGFYSMERSRTSGVAFHLFSFRVFFCGGLSNRRFRLAFSSLQMTDEPTRRD